MDQMGRVALLNAFLGENLSTSEFKNTIIPSLYDNRQKGQISGTDCLIDSSTESLCRKLKVLEK